MGKAGDPVVIVVGVGRSVDLTVDIFHQLGQIVQRIIGVADAVIIAFSGDLVFDHPLGQVIVIPGGDTAARIYDLGNSGDNRTVPLSPGITYAVIIVFTGDLILDHPLGQVIVIPGGDPAARIYSLGESGNNSPVPLSPPLLP